MTHPDKMSPRRKKMIWNCQAVIYDESFTADKEELVMQQ